MSKSNQKGRTVPGERFTRHTHTMTRSAAFRDLTGAEIKTLIALQRYYNGSNNGALFMSARKAVEETGLSRNAVMKAFRGLQEHGFIVAVVKGHFNMSGGAATCWRLTFEADQARGKPPTHDWQRWECGNKTAVQKVTETGAISAPRVGNGRFTGAISAPATTETSHVSNPVTGAVIEPHIVCHRQGAGWDEKQPRKHPETGLAVSASDVSADLLDALRERVRAMLKGSPPGTQTRLAASVVIPGGTLSKFLDGKGLPRQHFVALQLALRGSAIERAA